MKNDFYLLYYIILYKEPDGKKQQLLIFAVCTNNIFTSKRGGWRGKVGKLGC